MRRAARVNPTRVAEGWQHAGRVVILATPINTARIDTRRQSCLHLMSSHKSRHTGPWRATFSVGARRVNDVVMTSPSLSRVSSNTGDALKSIAFFFFSLFFSFLLLFCLFCCSKYF